MKPARTAARRRLPNSPFNVDPVEKPVEQYAEHDRVSHDQFGLGSVVCASEASAVTVDFGSGPVRLPIPCAKLTKL